MIINVTTAPLHHDQSVFFNLILQILKKNQPQYNLNTRIILMEADKKMFFFPPKPQVRVGLMRLDLHKQFIF